jgi:hypothetical protein
MADIFGIRGMLLEEAILYLLRVSGYRTLEILTPGNDPTINGDCYSGLKVLGRGGVHQIDAIADFTITLPFSYPHRLLVEAKCYADDRPIGIEFVRNAVGVLKDVGEFWVSRGGIPPKARYHYQYALFSSSRFTDDSEKYAFAHDIYLIPLMKSKFIQPIVRAIRKISSSSFGVGARQPVPVGMIDLRRAVRSSIRNPQAYDLVEVLADYREALPAFREFIQECRKVNQAMIAMIAGRFPIFLVPAPRVAISELQDEYSVRIRWDEGGWYIYAGGRVLFSFDLPPDLFLYYAEEGFLSPTQALNLKEEVFSEIQGITTINDQFHVIRLKLDREWLNSVRERINQVSGKSR